MLSPLPTQAQPINAGWTIFVNKDDPNKDAYKEIFTPLAIRRGMIKQGQKIENRWFEIENEVFEKRAWEEWLFFRYFYIGPEERPNYVLLLGDAEQIPLGFQIDLGENVFVGRLTFDELKDYEAYVEKLLTLEMGDEQVVEPQALFVAPEFNFENSYISPSTFYNEYLVPSLIESIRNKGIDILSLLNLDATKKNFLHAISNYNPFLVFVASYGLCAGSEKSIEYMRSYSGAICFPGIGYNSRPIDFFSAEDVDALPAHQSIFYGSTFFQYSSFGYGMSSASDFSIWKENTEYTQPENAFISALPKKLIAHPRGPVAYIGLIDDALIKTASNSTLSDSRRGEDVRLTRLRATLSEVAAGRPPSYSMWDMKEKYVRTMNYQLNVLRRPEIMSSWGEEEKEKYVDRWLYLTDSKNILVMGDPGAQSQLLM